MNKLLFKVSTLCMLFSVCSVAVAQRTLSGTVSSNDGPLPGATVIIKDSNRGTTTDFDGKFTIEASSDDVLVVSFVGYATQEVAVAEMSQLSIVLQEDQLLDEVVVTALGIERQRKSLTYAAQDVDSEELTRVKQTNPINSLSGKVSGVNITRSASGVGGSVKVTLRGNSSIGNNRPLYVVDGVPLSNPTAGQPDSTFGDINGGNRDGGDALSLINPDDIESISVLKGASASALYGSAGLNGVILIKTKKGKAGGYKVSFSSNITVDNAAYMLDLNEKAQSNVDAFLQTGVTNVNSIIVSGGTENAQTYFSYSNTHASGILPTNTLKQHTFNLRETAQLFDNKLQVNGSVLASIQNIKNRPLSGLYFNPLVGVYGFESDKESLSDYSKYEAFNVTRNIMKQRWFRGTSDIEQNPYWILHRNASEDVSKKIVASLNLNYKINEWLSVQSRGTYDNSRLEFEKKIYATTEATLAPANGRYKFTEDDFTQLYGDILANINTTFNENITLSGVIGASTTKSTTEALLADSRVSGGLQFANVFAIQNFNANPSVAFTQNSYTIKTNSVFASATIGLNDNLFVDLTARNDWSSTLPKENNSYFYPSVGITALLNDLIELGDKVSYAKIRASYAEVGNAFRADQVSPHGNITFGNGVSGIDPIRPFPGTTPKSERQRSFEVGTEWRFYNNRLGIDIGYYKTSTIDQYYSVPVTTTVVPSGIAGLNAGDIVNKGIEASVFAVPVRKEDFSWRTTLNYAANKNEILSIAKEDVDGLIPTNFFTLSSKGVNTFGSYLVKGGSFGDIYAHVIKRDKNGVPIYDKGAFVVEDSNQIDGLTKVGNANPDFTLGWNNSFNYKNFTLDFLIDGKFGGETMSMTQAIVEGFSNNSSRETANGNVTVVDLSGKTATKTAKEYYGKVGGRNGFTGEYIYSATNVRLAEFSLGYNISLNEKSFFDSMKASLIGSNLLFFYKEAPHDPNLTLSTGNALQGVDVLALPSTKSVGLNINLTF
jgi:TonB-dependent SusC/RagA subfamily outer membrane receptor